MDTVTLLYLVLFICLWAMIAPVAALISKQLYDKITEEYDASKRKSLYLLRLLLEGPLVFLRFKDK